MKYLFTLFLSILLLSVYGQDFYNIDEIQTIEVTFEQSNWDQLLENAYDSGEYTLAQTVAINGVVFDSVGVKYKGNSTYNPSQVKNPFHIELDTYKDQEYENYTDIKLSNVAKDPSFLREVLSYQIIRQYMDAPLSNYANVYVNGDLIGLYSNSESITKKFVNSRFGSKKNTFVKCNPPAGAGPQSNDFPNLEYMGEDSTNYYASYELKSDSGWDELIDLCDTLSNGLGDIETILDVDRALWMLALDNAMVNLDSYIGGFKQNYYLYRDDNGRFIPIIWDLNESFGRFTMTGSVNVNSTNAKQEMSPFLHEDDSDFPLISKLLEFPVYRRMYMAHYKTILLENFDNGAYYSIAENLRDLIDASVQADGNKLFDYDDFLANLDSDIGGGGPGGPGGGGGGGSSVGIASLMDGRSDFLLSQSYFTHTDPNITDVTYSTDSPIIGEALTITASITDAERALIGYRNERNDVFQKIDFVDDGLHNDGAAGDGVYGAEIIIDNAFTQFYIYAENDDAGKFSPQRAEYEYHLIIANSTITELGDLVINEFMASNSTTQADADGEYDDWIELYNNGTEAIDLTGYFMSDDLDNLSKWEFPAGASIEAGGYLIVWSDNDETQEGLHSNFKLSSAGESIYLTNAVGEILDEINYASQETDLAYGRFPNGTGPFDFLVPTFNAENTDVTIGVDEVLAQFELKLFPNPATDQIQISSDEIIMQLSIYDYAGKKIYESHPNARTTEVDLADLSSGMYFVKAVSEGSSFTSKTFVKVK